MLNYDRHREILSAAFGFQKAILHALALSLTTFIFKDPFLNQKLCLSTKEVAKKLPYSLDMRFDWLPECQKMLKIINNTSVSSIQN